VADIADLARSMQWLTQEPMGRQQTLFEHEARE